MLIEVSAAELASLNSQRFVQPPEVLRGNSYEQMNQALFVFLDRWVEKYRSH